METLKELGTGIPLRLGVPRLVWVFGSSILHHIIRDRGTRIKVSASNAIIWPSESYLDHKVKHKVHLFRQSLLPGN